jgi:hypothetical protein
MKYGIGFLVKAHYNNENKPENLNYGRAYAEKAKRIFAIWHSVLPDRQDVLNEYWEYKVALIISTNRFCRKFLLINGIWLHHFPYFGLDHSSSGNPVLHGGSTGEDVNMNARNAYFGANGASGFRDIVLQDYRNKGFWKRDSEL